MTDRMQVNLRQTALEILLEAHKNEALLNVVLGEALAKYQKHKKNERSFISRLVQGTEEKRIELDYIIDNFSKTPVKKQKPFIRTLLEMSVYQLKYMDSVPASAVCNEAVKLAVKKNFGTLKGFVNGVLRNISRNLDSVEYPDREKDERLYLSVRYSIPTELLDCLLNSYDVGALESMFTAFEREKATYIRCNTSKLTADELASHLRDEGVSVSKLEEYPQLDYALKISGYDYLRKLKSFADGEFQVQDLSSMLAGEGNIIKETDDIIDVCAAPGGKSINAALKAVRGHVEARDISEKKTAMIEENIERLGLQNISCKVWDATVRDETCIEKADVVIADLPCSGLGIIGRKPDIKYHVTQEKIDGLAALQRNILATVWEYVKENGHLIYSTCTITPQENQENVKWFLENYPFELVGEPKVLLPGSGGKSGDGSQACCNRDNSGDGFFIARMRRKPRENGEIHESEG